MLLGLVGAAVAAWVFWPASPPELEVISAEVLLLDPPPTLASPPGADPPHAIETLRVRYRTDPEAHVVIDPRYYRPAEVDLLLGDAAKAHRQLGWTPKVDLDGLVAMMVDADMELARREKTLRDAGHAIRDGA